MPGTRIGYLTHVETVLNDAHLNVCDMTTELRDGEWAIDERRLLALIDAAITYVHGMRESTICRQNAGENARLKGFTQ